MKNTLRNIAAFVAIILLFTCSLFIAPATAANSKNTPVAASPLATCYTTITVLDSQTGNPIIGKIVEYRIASPYVSSWNTLGVTDSNGNISNGWSTDLDYYELRVPGSTKYSYFYNGSYPEFQFHCTANASYFPTFNRYEN